ncbi:hypothetical protein K8R30_04110 [archaeon]|nr:hypothetical protein [archaeon]
MSGIKKRGLSNLVAYVLLITITISLSVFVYGWLKTYVSGEEVETCPSNVNIIISGYECVSGVSGNLSVKLKNKGLFNVDGYVLRVHDRLDAEFGFFVLDNTGAAIAPGDEINITYNFTDYPGEPLTDVTFIEVQLFILEDGRVACETHASQKAVCS